MSEGAATEAAAPEAAATEAQEATTTTAQAAEATTTDASTEAAETAATTEASEADKALKKEAQSLRKRLRDAEAKIEAEETAKLSEVEREKKRATDAEEKVTALTNKVRTSNLQTALKTAVEGLSDTKAKAAVRLLDNIEYDDDTDEPTNLADRITAAKVLFGDEPFTPTATAAPSTGDPVAGVGGAVSETDAQALARIQGNRGGGDVFQNPAAHGGGVVMPVEGVGI